jgi:holin-like protein
VRGRVVRRVQLFFKVVVAVALLIVLDRIGEWLHVRLRVPLPGPLIGMLLLGALAHWWNDQSAGGVGEVSAFLARHLSFFFVPVAVGVVTSAALFAGHWVVILGTLLVTTMLTFVIVAWTMQRLLGPQAGEKLRDLPLVAKEIP